MVFTTELDILMELLQCFISQFLKNQNWFGGWFASRENIDFS